MRFEIAVQTELETYFLDADQPRGGELVVLAIISVLSPRVKIAGWQPDMKVDILQPDLLLERQLLLQRLC